MALPHASPGQVINVRPLGANLANEKSTTLLKTQRLEAIRVVMHAGKQIDSHQAPGEITVQCLEGAVDFTALGKTQTLRAGDLVYLPAQEPHSVKCVEDASFLLTILLDR